MQSGGAAKEACLSALACRQHGLAGAAGLAGRAEHVQQAARPTQRLTGKGCRACCWRHGRGTAIWACAASCQTAASMGSNGHSAAISDWLLAAVPACAEDRWPRAPHSCKLLALTDRAWLCQFRLADMGCSWIQLDGWDDGIAPGTPQRRHQLHAERGGDRGGGRRDHDEIPAMRKVAQVRKGKAWSAKCEVLQGRDSSAPIRTPARLTTGSTFCRSRCCTASLPDNCRASAPGVGRRRERLQQNCRPGKALKQAARLGMAALQPTPICSPRAGLVKLLCADANLDPARLAAAHSLTRPTYPHKPEVVVGAAVGPVHHAIEGAARLVSRRAHSHAWAVILRELCVAAADPDGPERSHCQARKPPAYSVRATEEGKDVCCPPLSAGHASCIPSNLPPAPREQSRLA